MFCSKNTLRIRLLWVGIIVCLLTVPDPVAAAEDANRGKNDPVHIENVTFQDGREFGHWTMNYYLKPEPEKLAWVMIRWGEMASNRGLSIRPHMNVFFGMALQDSDTRYIEPSFQAVTEHGNPQAKKTLGYALWFIDKPETNRYFRRALEQWQDPAVQSYLHALRTKTPTDLDQPSNHSAVHMDSLWSAFFATGKEQFVEQIIPAITLVERGHGREIIRGGAAQWSLTSNAIHHDRVLDICQKVYARSDGLLRKELGKIIEKATKKRGES